jgi:formate/nitrite transporter FocA (FNT family)
VIAGALIGFGVIINLLTSPPALGAALFSFGLLAIIQLKIPLFTGRIGFLINRETQPYLLFLLGNILGIMLAVACYACANPGFNELIMSAAIAKFSKSYFTILLYGCLCGFLIHIAVKCKTPIITIGAIMIFILIGSEHCIADVPYLYVYCTWPNVLKWLLVIAGNSVGAMFAEGFLNNEKI